jgi:prepilin-type N-terminal cleavage/methylation domain-containing protein
MSSSSRKGGFTLVEILVAMAIIVTIVSMVYGSYFATSKSTQACKSRITISQQGRKVLEQMARQIRCSYAGKADKHTNPTSTFKQKEAVRASAIDYFNGNSDEPNGEILHLVTTNGFFYGPDQAKGLFDIAYKFNKSSGTLSINQRRFVHISEPLIEQNNWRPLIRNIEYVELAFFDGQQWLAEWDFKEKKELPNAVKIIIACKDENARRYYYRTISCLSCSKKQGNGTSSERLVSINK